MACSLAPGNKDLTLFVSWGTRLTKPLWSDNYCTGLFSQSPSSHRNAVVLMHISGTCGFSEKINCYVIWKGLMRMQSLHYLGNVMSQFIEGAEYHEWCLKPHSPGQCVRKPLHLPYTQLYCI